MNQKKIITIFGATGAQGGGLARAILNDPNSEFSARVVTRDVHSDKARQLADMGAEVVAADVDDKDSIRKALKGAYGAYFVTFFWAHLSPEKEYDEAVNMAEAAKDAGLKHVIWSTLEDTRKWVPIKDNRMPTLQGKYKVPHFDAKGAANQLFIKAGVPTTFLVASFYWENMIYFGMGPQRGEDGKLSITFPMGNKKLAGIGAEDIGKCAYGIFRNGDSLIGKTIGVAGEHLSVGDMAKEMSDTFNEKITYNAVTPAQYRNFGFPGAEDVGNMFQFYADFEEDVLKLRDLKFSRELNPDLQSFKDWLKNNAVKLSIG